MAIGQRIRFFRNRKGMTQKYLGEILGFVGKTSDVRMAQYESEARIPKQELVKNMAHFLDVSTHALTVPDIDTYIGLMHTFFALEDMYGLKIDEVDGEVCLRLDKSDYSTYTSMDKMLRAWLAEAKKLGIPLIGVVDTNHNPDAIDYVIPGNDDSAKAVALYARGIADAILEGRANAINEVVQAVSAEGSDEFVDAEEASA